MKAGTKQRIIAQLITCIILGIGISLSSTQRVTAQAPSPFLIAPFYGQETISQFFGTNGHAGIDFGSVDYEPVLASASGTVELVQWYSNQNACHQSPDNQGCGYGLHIMIDHGNGYHTLYAHLSSVASGLSPGTYVRQGQVIGMSDHTG
jgi:murein DD-endopeptidase MepM/ murein hydrolase activator NlpD